MTTKESPIIFKCDPDLWDMLASGEKTWDARRYDMADDRIYRLSWGEKLEMPHQIHPYASGIESRWHEIWKPDEPTVSFQNKVTGEVLTFKYKGMEFTPWAPGWCILLLGERIEAGGKE